MAGAEIIGAAIGVLLLVLVGYIMVGSTLTSAEIVTTAQKDVTLQNEVRLNTGIKIRDIPTFPDPVFLSVSPYTLTLYIKNTGSEAISDFKHMDIFIATDSTIPPNIPIHYSFDPAFLGAHNQNTLQWSYTSPILVPPSSPVTPEKIHPNMLDPGEIMKVELTDFPSSPSSYEITVTTANGVLTTYP